MLQSLHALLKAMDVNVEAQRRCASLRELGCVSNHDALVPDETTGIVSNSSSAIVMMMPPRATRQFAA